MKEKSMMKQQPSAMQSQLSKVCRWLMCFGMVKVALLVALASGYSLPEFDVLSFLKDEQSKSASQVAKVETLPADQAPKNEVPAAVKPVEASAMQANALENTATVAVQENPQGSAAVLAAKQHKPSEKAKATLSYMPETAIATTAPMMPKKPEQASPKWWDNILSLKSLPFPRLGLDQVAYAATLDSPPPPAASSSAAPTPFSPPQPSKNAAAAQPVPQVLPAGIAGPQLGVVQPNPLVPNPNPPTPNLNAYVPPEDPNQMQQELARREQELLMLKKQTEQRLKELQAAEKKVKGMLTEAKTVEGNKVGALTNMYVNMKPKQAAKALETMDENIAVKILSSMKPKQAGEILSYADPVKTAKLTEILSRMQLGN